MAALGGLTKEATGAIWFCETTVRPRSNVKQTFMSRILYERVQLPNDIREALNGAGLLCPGTFAYARLHIDILGSNGLLKPHVAALLDLRVTELLHSNEMVVL
jgi:hypothetical protein